MDKILLNMNDSRDWERVCDIISEGVYITNAQGMTLYVNHAYEAITGIPRSAVIGKDMYHIVEEGWLSKSITQRVIERKEQVTEEQLVRSGKIVVLQGNPVYVDGEILMVVTFVKDVTSFNKMREELGNAQVLIDQYKMKIRELDTPRKFVAESPAFLKVIDLARKVAHVDSTVLILGESGTGKEVVAKEIYENSHRANQVFLKINCGAIPENLLESELFGYEAGAFTGAKKSGHIGIFEMARNGTVFLDEVGDMPLHLQVKLLRVLQEKTLTRIGSTKDIKIDTRVIAATNRNLEEMVENQTFRKDLYYRLNVVDITVPPLRERKEDIPYMVEHFVNRMNLKYGFRKKVGSGVIKKLMGYDWPGNVRELENVIERMVVTADDNFIETYQVQFSKEEEERIEAGANTGPNTGLELMSLKEACEQTERELILEAARRCKTTYEMAEVLQISQPTVSRKLKKYLREDESIHKCIK